MAEKPVVLGQTAARQLMDMMKRDARTYRNLPPPPMRQPVIRESITVFKAIIWDKREYIIEDPQDNFSSDPAFDDPLLTGCPPAFPALKRGEFSWVEAAEFIPGNPALATTDRDFGQAGVWVPKPDARFGIAGQCDAALEVNRFNGNIHLVYMVVDLWETIDVNCSSSVTMHGDPADENASSVFDILGQEVSAVSTRKRYWFNLGVPRSDCAPSYFVTIAPDNDTP